MAEILNVLFDFTLFIKQPLCTHKSTVKVSLGILPNRFHCFLQFSGNERISILADGISRTLVILIQIFKNVSDFAANLTQPRFKCGNFRKIRVK